MSSSSRRLAGRRVVASSTFSPDASEKLMMSNATSAYNYGYNQLHYQRRPAARRTAVAGCYRGGSGRGPASAPTAAPTIRCFRCLRAGVARVLRFLFRRKKAGSGGGGGRGSGTGITTSCASSVSSFSSTSSSSSRPRGLISSSVAPITGTVRATRPPPSPYCGYVLDDTYRHQSQDIQDCIDFIKYSSCGLTGAAASYGAWNWKSE